MNKNKILLYGMYWLVIGTTTIAAIGVWFLVGETRSLQDSYYQNITNLSVEYCAFYFNNLWDSNQSVIIDDIGHPLGNISNLTNSSFFMPFGNPNLIGAPEWYIEYLEEYYAWYGVDRYDIIKTPEIKLPEHQPDLQETS